MGQTPTKITEVGGIPPLIAMVQDGNNVQKEKAAAALRHLAVNTANKKTIAEAGGIPPLIAMAQDGNEVQKENAAAALRHLAVNTVNKKTIAEWGGIPPLIALARDGNNVQKEKAAAALWHLAIENSSCQNAIMSEAGAVDFIVHLALNGTSTQQENASGVLGFLAQHLDLEIKSQVATRGGVEALLSFISNPDNRKRMHEGLVALLGLCVDGDNIVRSGVEKVGGCEILTKLIQSDDEQIKSLAGKILSWLAGSLCELANMCSEMHEAEPLCRHLVERMQALSDREVYIVEALKARVQALLLSSVDKPRLVRLVGARSLTDGLADLHREIDGLDCQENKGLWQARWEAERVTMRQKLFGCEVYSLVKDFDDVNAQTEALTLLSHEVRQHKSCYTKDERDFLKAVVSSLVGLSGLEVLPEEKWFIARHEVRVEKESFNHGSFGEIYHGTYMNAPVVIKCIEISSESNRNDFLREVNIWHDASRHPNIVQLYGACHVGTPCFMVCKYVAGGSLPEYLRRQVKTGRSCAWQSLLDVTHGLQLLHSRGIIHGDLKGNNILVEGNTAMLTDFGMSVFDSEPSPQFDHLGAIRWRAPEFIATGKISFEADVYSLGMCIVEAVSGMLPWGLVPDTSVKWHFKNGKFLQQPKSMTDEQWALVCAMCDFDPAKRMKLDDAEKRIKMFADAEEEAMWKINTRAA